MRFMTFIIAKYDLIEDLIRGKRGIKSERQPRRGNNLDDPALSGKPPSPVQSGRGLQSLLGKTHDPRAQSPVRLGAVPVDCPFTTNANRDSLADTRALITCAERPRAAD